MLIVLFSSNFSNYVNRFSMHSQGQKEINNHFWSYNIGPVHLIAFSTEFHYFTQFGTHQIENQVSKKGELYNHAILTKHGSTAGWRPI